VGEVIKFSLIY